VSQITQRWRPPSFRNLHKQIMDVIQGPQASASLDDAMQKAFQNDYSLENQVAATTFGSISVTGSALKVPTGLSAVQQCTGTIDAGATAHANTLTVTPSATPGAIDIYVWMPTSSSVTTPIAATNKVVVRWSARGTP
jgi:hypothetical protein